MAKRAQIDWRQSPSGAAGGLRACCAVAIARYFSNDECAAWARGVLGAEPEWTESFGGDQFSLGRAFYTHLEEDQSKEYFADAAASDLRVEAHAPGLQRRMRALVAEIVGAAVVPRPGWCGPGVHIFPAGGHVAEHGGVVHFDTEGLSQHHVARRAPALTVVAMLQPPELGGDLRVWDVAYAGRDDVTDDELRSPSVLASYGVGGIVVIDSYGLHQIQPFEGDRDRISVTVHAAEIDPGRWETWF